MSTPAIRFFQTDICRVTSCMIDSSSPTCSATQSVYLWLSGFFYCRPGWLELSVWRTTWTVASCGQFQTVT